MSKLPPGSFKKTLGRVRWFLGSADVQTAQSQPMTGTPFEVPLPRNTSRREAVAVSSTKSPRLRIIPNKAAEPRVRPARALLYDPGAMVATSEHPGSRGFHRGDARDERLHTGRPPCAPDRRRGGSSGERTLRPRTT